MLIDLSLDVTGLGLHNKAGFRIWADTTALVLGHHRLFTADSWACLGVAGNVAVVALACLTVTHTPCLQVGTFVTAAIQLAWCHILRTFLAAFTLNKYRVVAFGAWAFLPLAVDVAVGTRTHCALVRVPEGTVLELVMAGSAGLERKNTFTCQAAFTLYPNWVTAIECWAALGFTGQLAVVTLAVDADVLTPFHTMFIHFTVHLAGLGVFWALHAA